MFSSSRHNLASRDVGVIIPAYNASDTVATAVTSALAEPETSEVIVVDDASSDRTFYAAVDADDGSRRLTVIRLEKNGGPSAARNAAIAASTAPVIAVLDADDRFLSGRLAHLLSQPDWDIIADDILFQSAPAPSPASAPGRRDCAVYNLDLETFVRGNLTRSDRSRRELGFLHPLIRRSFLEKSGLSYDEALRLGEDYDLYTRALVAGARFKLVDEVGYVAVERRGSLSGSHRTVDLLNLQRCDDRLIAGGALRPHELAAVRAHRRQIAARHRLRAFLDEKSDGGALQACRYLCANPSHFPAVGLGVARDKWRAMRAAPHRPDGRPVTLFGRGFVHAPFRHTPSSRIPGSAT